MMKNKITRPPRQQRQANSAVYLLPVQQSSRWDALPYPAPHQRRRSDDPDCRYAPRHCGILQE